MFVLFLFFLITVSTIAFGAAGSSVIYQIDGKSYEGYYISPVEKAPFVLLIHDWDGLTDYEIKRADMLAEIGYTDQFADLANELESSGIKHEMITYGGAQHAFTVFDGGRYQEAADKKSWKRFVEFLADTLK